MRVDVASLVVAPCAGLVTDTSPPRLGGRDLRGWRQVRCGACGLPPRHCVCDELPSIETRTRVLIVMHAVEAVRSTNTGRLVARMLPRASVRLRGALDAAPEAAPEGRRLVLFPADDARPLRGDDASDDLVLVVPDGTWAQTRRIVRRDPAARGAEIVALPTLCESCYGLRRSVREGAVCTLEAVAAALGVLEGRRSESSIREGFALWKLRAELVRAGG